MKKLETRINDQLELVELNQNKIQVGNNIFHIIKDSDKLKFRQGEKEWIIDEITHVSSDTLRIELAGYTIDINVCDPIDLATSGKDENSGEIVSPMSGIVSDIRVKVGEIVAEGDTLLIISAMKMENKITSSISGKVVNIYVKPNEQIEWGKVLLIVEASHVI